MTGDVSVDIETQVTREGDRPYRWDDINSEDQENIRRFLQRRQNEEDTDDDDLYHDLSVLVGLASMVADGSLSSASLRDFEEPENRPTRTLAHFLVFVGQHTPKCSKCGNREYTPTDKFPNKMRCRDCGFLFTIRELAHMPYSDEVKGDF
jgi:hypothetical protein